MRYVLAIGLVLLGAATYAQADKIFNLKPVVTLEDVFLCGEASGKGALVFDIDKEGNRVGDYEPFCVLEVK